MSSSCGRTCGFNLDFIKSSSTSTSSPSSTTSESTNSPQSTLIFTKKPRTNLRKRPNQTFHEAATLLSSAHPNLFSTKNLKKPEKFSKPIITEYNDSSSEPLLQFREYENNNDNDAFSFLLESKPSFIQTEPNKVFFGVQENINNKPCELSTEVANCQELELESEEFDCESMLDEEIEEGIDSVMGGGRRDEEENDNDNDNDDDKYSAECGGGEWFGCGGKPRPTQRSHLQLGRHCGKLGWVRALRRVDDDDDEEDDTKWWNFFVVDMLQILPRMKNAAAADNNLVPTTVRRMRTKTMMKNTKNKRVKELPAEVAVRKGLLLKLNYDDVRNAWSDRGSPFAGESRGNDVTLRSLAGDLKSKTKRKKV